MHRNVLSYRATFLGMRVAQLCLCCVLMAVAGLAQQKSTPYLHRADLPIYPIVARQARIEGAVRISFRVERDGTVSDVEVVSGHPMLRAAAVDNVRSWRFRLTRQTEPSQLYETEFVYRLSGKDVRENPRLTVSLESFRRVDITSDVVLIPDSPVVQQKE